MPYRTAYSFHFSIVQFKPGPALVLPNRNPNLRKRYNFFPGVVQDRGELEHLEPDKMGSDGKGVHSDVLGQKRTELSRNQTEPRIISQASTKVHGFISETEVGYFIDNLRACDFQDPCDNIFRNTREGQNHSGRRD